MPPSPKIVCVVPSIRPERMETFRQKWADDFKRYDVTLVTVWDGARPSVEIEGGAKWYADELFSPSSSVPIERSWDKINDLFCRRTDAVRNIGFVVAPMLVPDFTEVLTLDDDVWPRQPFSQTWKDGPLSTAHEPRYTRDPIGDHLAVLSKRVCLSWMNTAHGDDHKVRGFPYSIREEAPVMLSHGVWDGVPDFDGETQLRLAARDGSDGGGIGLPMSLDYYKGPVPRGVKFPLCGMNVMVRREALPYFYFAPMGPDTKVKGLNRFADIFMGVHLKEKFDELGWACYTGGSTVYHSRASDAAVNFEQEKLGREWLELLCNEDRTCPPELVSYLRSYRGNRMRYEAIVRSLLETDHVPD